METYETEAGVEEAAAGDDAAELGVETIVEVVVSVTTAPFL
jgi:hypothetical protein